MSVCAPSPLRGRKAVGAIEGGRTLAIVRRRGGLLVVLGAAAGVRRAMGRARTSRASSWSVSRKQARLQTVVLRKQTLYQSRRQLGVYADASAVCVLTGG